MIDKIIETLKTNENHKNSLIVDTFFYDFLLEYCPNYGLICDSSGYEEYFKAAEKILKSKFCHIPFTVNLEIDFLKEDPQKIIGILKPDSSMFGFYYQFSLDLFGVVFYTEFPCTGFDLKESKRFLSCKFLSANTETLKNKIKELKDKKLIFKTPELIQKTLGNGNGGFSAGFQR